MSSRSTFRAPNCRRAREAAAKKPHGLARKLARRDARTQAGDFTFQLRALPAYCADQEQPGRVDHALRNMYRTVCEAHRTRSCKW